MSTIAEALKAANAFIWGYPLIIALFGTHLYFTFRLRGIQRYMPLAIRLSFSKDDKDSVGDLSPFGSLATALAATIGTGNIIGVATAISLGGPGAVLWCWLTGVFGIATKYSEGILAVKYRVKGPDGTLHGGPMYALKYGLKQNWLAVAFAIFTAIAAFGIGNMIQANALATMCQESFAIPPFWTGSVVTALVAVVMIGGIKSIGRVCSKLVPFMALFYIIGCLGILVTNWHFLLPAIKLIIGSAFTGTAASGGFVGATVTMAARFGVARGLFSNESGLGSSPIVAAAAQTRNPVRQALISATGTFWDTVVVCAMTGLVIVSSVLANPSINTSTSTLLTYAAFSQLPMGGNIILTVGMLTFVFSTILGWSYYGEKAVEFLFGGKAVAPYRMVWVAAVFVGSIIQLSVVWDFADLANGLMAIPNLISLVFLSNVVVDETKRYLWNNRIDEYDPADRDDGIIEEPARTADPAIPAVLVTEDCPE